MYEKQKVTKATTKPQRTQRLITQVRQGSKDAQTSWYQMAKPRGNGAYAALNNALA